MNTMGVIPDTWVFMYREHQPVLISPIIISGQWRSQNAEKYVHQRESTGARRDYLQLRPFFNMGTSLKGKNLLPEGANSFL